MKAAISEMIGPSPDSITLVGHWNGEGNAVGAKRRAILAATLEPQYPGYAVIPAGDSIILLKGEHWIQFDLDGNKQREYSDGGKLSVREERPDGSIVINHYESGTNGPVRVEQIQPSNAKVRELVAVLRDLEKGGPFAEARKLGLGGNTNVGQGRQEVFEQVTGAIGTMLELGLSFAPGADLADVINAISGDSEDTPQITPVAMGAGGVGPKARIEKVAAAVESLRKLRATVLESNNLRGNAFEASVRAALQAIGELPPNVRKRLLSSVTDAGRARRTVPDAVVIGDRIVDVRHLYEYKDVRSRVLELTPQLQAQLNFAERSGIAYDLIVSPQTKIDKNLYERIQNIRGRVRVFGDRGFSELPMDQVSGLQA
jgi:hypothetical protein